MSLKQFLKSKLFFRQLIIAAILTILLLYGVILVLRIYTNHGDSLQVPDLSGITVEQARQVALNSKLKIQISDSLYLKDAQPGTVIGQLPTPGSRVKKHRLIHLTICTATPEQVAMPKLTDIAYRQALNVIESSGLEIGEVEYKPSEYPDLVLEQRVFGEIAEVGMHVPKGTKVDLSVGQTFSGEQIDIPDLLGENLRLAEDTIGKMSLVIGAIIFDDTFTSAEDTANATIWKQRPETNDNQKIFQGQSIDLWLTVDQDKIEKALQNK